MTKISIPLLFLGLCATGLMVFTNHMGRAITFSNYFFALLTIVTIYNLLINK